ncbi:hypothetical protein [Anaerosporobacter sp.]|uniref:hypothetical protein n=1 Tax=Anaerosporobacter sp. TaxID=1872529 RepID=UPI00286ED30F|nr:hypothetical protein [Anaerosporobacter sp.]
MEQISCLNFCDILNYLKQEEETIDDIIKRTASVAGYEHVERIYIGSYFCAQYFLHMDDNLIDEIVTYAKSMEMRLTLVIPIIAQKELENVLNKIERYCDYFENCMDEITVNDYGMLAYIHETYDVRLNMGRLFMKDYRDPRYPVYFKSELRPKIFTKYLSRLIREYQIDGMEFDLTHLIINFESKPSGILIGLHTPYCYMTVGQICEYASINKEVEKKFRPNQPCAKECQETIIRYDLRDNREWIRVGRGLFFENRECQIEGINKYRAIYFPVEWEGLS